MTFEQALNDKRDIRSIPTAELTAQLEAYRTAKVWRGRYFEINTEVQRRATRRWVHDDVMGNTFAPLDGALD